MQNTQLKKRLSLIVCIVLIAAMALFTTACNGNTTSSNPDSSQGLNTDSKNDNNILGEGETEFYFTVTDADGKETSFEIHTDKKTVGEALVELELIEGEQGDYGLYVKTVNGITVDYENDGKYWAFYMNGEYAMSGVDTTDITEGATYSFKVE